MTDDRPRRVADEISTHVNQDELSKSIATSDNDRRCGMIGHILDYATSKSNLATHKEGSFWWDPELGYWVELERFEMDEVVKVLVSSLGLDWADVFKRYQRIKQMAKESICLKKLNPKREIVAFKNCILDVNTGKVNKFSPEFHCIYGLPYDYDPNAQCPKWIEFLDQVLPDLDSRSILQEYLGCIFIDRHTTKLEKILYLYGNGANGKGVVYETIKGIVGSSNVTSYDISHLAATTSEGMYALAECDGKLLNYCSDAGKKEFSASKFKTIVSGEPTPARRPYRSPFEACNLPIMISNSNELPVTTDSTHGFSRRLILLTFDMTISEENQDKKLHIKMIKEYPGILNWILQGRDRFVKTDYKFTTSKKVVDRIKDYEIESNSILGYLRESRFYPVRAYIGHIPSIMAVKTLYERYSTWCISMGLKSFSSNKFGSKLKEKGFVCGRRAVTEYGIYELPNMDDYRKIYARGQGDFTLEEYGVMLYGRDGDNVVGTVMENIIEKDAKEPIINWGRETDGGDECP